MSLEQATRDLPCFDRAAVALRKAEKNYAEAVSKLKAAHEVRSESK
jgi:hypothetical protein